MVSGGKTMVAAATAVATSAVIVGVGAAPASAKVTIEPSKGERSSYTIFPWQSVDLGFGVRYSARRGKEFTAVDNTLEAVRSVVRKRGMSFPVSNTATIDGSTGSGLYTINTTYRYATTYWQSTYYVRKKVWFTTPVTCSVVDWEGYLIDSFVDTSSWNYDTERSAYQFDWLCTYPDGSEVSANYDSGESIASPYFTASNGVIYDDSTPLSKSQDVLWRARPAGSAPCADGTVSAEDPFYCFEEFTGAPLTITADFHTWEKRRVPAGKAAHYTGWRTKKVSKTYRITVK